MLDQDDLEARITFWRDVESTLKYPGFGGGGYVASKAPVLKSFTAIIGRAGPGPVVYGVGAYTIATSSKQDLEAEVARRGQLGSMTPLHVGRFGPK